MKNSAIKKFLGNKNTVTILGVLLIVVILYIGYNVRINQAVSLKSVPVASTTIAPKTEITSSMITTVSVPTEFLTGSYYSKQENIVGKYTNYNATLVEGSLFYTDLLVAEEDLPDAMFTDLEEGYRVATISLSSVTGLYGTPGDYIDIYFSGINSDNKVMFGQFLSGLKILSVVDANGNNVYGNITTEEVGSPTTMYIEVPEDLYILFGRFNRINEVSDLNAYLVLTPHSEAPNVDNVDIYITSKDVKDLINNYSQEIDKTEEKVTTDTE